MGVVATAAEILTSPQVAAQMLADRHEPGSRVLVVGAPWLADSVQDAGLRPVQLATDEPAAVVQGHSPDTGWRNLAEACIALRAGADWVACNVDSTLPSDRGLLPGNGAMVAALIAATGLRPRVAGKPERPLLDEAIRRTSSQTPLVVGDRLDTDIACAHAADVPSLMVLTGVSTAGDLLVAPPAFRPTYLAFDLRGLVEEDHAVKIPATDRAGHLEWTVGLDGGVLSLAAVHPTAHGDAVTDASALRALCAAGRARLARGWLDRHPHCAGVTRRPRGQRRADALWIASLHRTGTGARLT